MIMGPSCGMFLALMGAEVIKIEPPAGDKTRNLTGMGSPFFPLFNRSKKSVQPDLSSDAGKRALDRLLVTADVFVDNFAMYLSPRWEPRRTSCARNSQN